MILLEAASLDYITGVNKVGSKLTQNKLLDRLLDEIE